MNTKLAVLLGALGVALTISACSYSIASNYEPNTMTETHAATEIKTEARYFYLNNEDLPGIENNEDIQLAEARYNVATIITPKMMLAIYDNEIDIRFAMQSIYQINSYSFYVGNIKQKSSFRYVDEDNYNQISNTIEDSITYDKISNYYELQNVDATFAFRFNNFNAETQDMQITANILIEAYFYNTKQIQQPIIKSITTEQQLVLNGNYYAGDADFFTGYNFIDKIRNFVEINLDLRPYGTALNEERIYNEGYDAGETAGQNNVINNPNEYNLYTGEQLAQVVENANTEIVDLPGVMLHVLSMPWTFISSAFDLTLWPGTPYQINFANIFKGLIAILALMFIIKMFTNGFNALGNVASSAEDRKNKKADTNLKNSQAKLNDAKTSKIESKGKKEKK